MSQHFLLSAKARTLSLGAIMRMPMKLPVGIGFTLILRCAGSTIRSPTAWTARARTNRSPSFHGCAARNSASTITSAASTCSHMLARWHGKRTIGGWTTGRSTRRLPAWPWRIRLAGRGLGTGSGHGRYKPSQRFLSLQHIRPQETQQTRQRHEKPLQIQ